MQLMIDGAFELDQKLFLVFAPGWVIQIASGQLRQVSNTFL